MSDNILKIAISQGDINGISYELFLKTFEDDRMTDNNITVLYGSSKVLAYHRKAMDLPAIKFNTVNNVQDAGSNRLNIINCGVDDIVVELSNPLPEAEEMAQKALDRALNDLKQHLIDALVIAPSSINNAAYLRSVAGVKPLKILVSNSLRIAIATSDISLSEVAGTFTSNLLVTQLRALHHSLVHDFLLTMPRIAVLSLNPGKGIKERQYGKEENEVIIPALKTANDNGIICFGPYSAEDFFPSNDYRKFDAILAIYDDQAVAPFRLLSMSEGAIFYAGMPFVVTAPDIGVSYNLAGKNESQETVMRNAIYLATDIVNNRAFDREINANPLRKQYFERGSDNERLDLTEDEET
ncbi:MAG: 4-hydroxythreonine-4-phosphate dehydrogenase PdxA [Dysgonamonadaceae bacterium]|jgi:4-hydroxythreonine-4-phosphate dehydrogenase|nr:4-hydroxythreonine-4-phosphate dehydrogenase PdxA [Dysgonamonadaceae bacterium]